MTDLAQKILRRALENGARMLEAEARRRKHWLLGGVPEIEQEVAIIRENLDALSAVPVVKP